MKMKVAFYICLGIAMLNNGCSKSIPKYDNTLVLAEKIVTTNPDSALSLIKSIPDENKLDTMHYNKYILLQVQAKYKCYQDIRHDTLIFKTASYFENQKDNLNAARASYYSGRVRQAQGNQEKALQAYLQAQTMVTPFNDKQLKGLIGSAIGDVFFQKKMYIEAQDHFVNAESLFEDVKDYKNASTVLNFLGCCCVVRGQLDSAMLYYNKGLSMIDTHKISNTLKSMMIQNMGVAYSDVNNLGKAKVYFRQALALTSDSISQAQLYQNLARVFDKENNADSTRFYFARAMTFLQGKKALETRANIFFILAGLEEQAKNTEQALRYKDLFCENLIKSLNASNSTEVFEIQRKYNYQRVLNENYELDIRNQRFLLLCTFLMLVISIIGLLSFKRHVTSKKYREEAELKIQQLSEVAEKYETAKPEKMENPYQKIVLQHFNILRKVAALNSRLSDRDKTNGLKVLRIFNEIVYGEEILNWEHLYQALNRYNNGFFDRIRKQYPQLAETEFKLCCLMYAEFDNTDISVILNLTIGSTRTLKVGVRKKLGLEKLENFVAFLNTHVK